LKEEFGNSDPMWTPMPSSPPVISIRRILENWPNMRWRMSDPNLFGKSREHAPLALKAAGISCVIAESFARIFYRNGFNQGLPLLESFEASQEIKDGDLVQVDLATGEIFDQTQQKKYFAKPIPPFMQELIEDGGLIPHLRKRGLKGSK
jgi:3-isopropylmalate dehydratase small subunit